MLKVGWEVLGRQAGSPVLERYLLLPSVDGSSEASSVGCLADTKDDGSWLLAGC